MYAYHCIGVFPPKKSSILSGILCNPQFYHTYIRWKSSVLSENVSTSFFNYILIVFVCWSSYLIFSNKSSILSIILCNPQFYHAYVRWKYSVLYKIFSSSYSNNTLVVFVCLSLYLTFCFPKYQFYKLCYIILNFNIHMLDDNLWFYQKTSLFHFFNYILIVFVRLSLYLWNLPQKSSII